MDNVYYQHTTAPSFEAKLIQSIMDLLRIKQKLSKKMTTNRFEQNPAKPTKSLWRNYHIHEAEQNGRKVWNISPKENQSDVIILYLHGGAYVSNINKQHWGLIEQLAHQTNARIVVPDYPLAPKNSCTDTYAFIEIIYHKLITDYPTKRIVFIGDSAGAGLAFGFVQQLRNTQQQQPNQLILFSPWLDVTMSNPQIEELDKNDKLLSVTGLKDAGKSYAGKLSLKDYRVSPIYGDLTSLCGLSIFTGTNDILNADAQKCQQLMTEQQLNINYFEYPKIFHDWVIISNLKESQDVIHKVSQLIN